MHKRMILFIFLLILFSQAAGKGDIIKCPIRVPHPPLHKYRQQGDLIIGGIASHSLIISGSTDFTEEPQPTLSEELL